MAKKNKPDWVQQLEYFGYRFGLMVLRCVPRECGARLGKMLGKALFYLDKRHYQVARENLEKSNCSLPSRFYDPLILKVYQNLGILLWEMVASHFLHPDNIDQIIKIHGRHYADEAFDKGGSAIFVTGHIGNWELLGAGIALKGVALHSVARPLKNPYIEKHLKSERERYGQVIITKKGAINEAMRLIKQNKHVAFILDQNAGSNGEFVEFFGRLASTFTTPANLAYRFNKPILLGYAIRREGQFFFDIYVDPPIFPNLKEERKKEIHRLTQLYTSYIEAMVRRFPEQWTLGWLHRRWKSQPRITNEEGKSKENKESYFV